MKLCRYNDDRVGLVLADGLHDATAALAALPAFRYPLPKHDPLIAALPGLRAALQAEAARNPALALDSVRLASPVANPGKIIAAPVNYTKHLEEVLADKGIHHGNLINEIHRAGLFLKATSSLVGASDGVRLSHTERRNDPEVELVVVIGKAAKDVPAAKALDYVAGYCIGLDITIRGPEERSFRKSPDSYTVLGPWMVTADELTDPTNLELTIRVNGELRQDANTSDLILGVRELVELASAFYTLHPGDVIMTGTPQGVAAIQPGDSMLAEIQHIGTMKVAVHPA